MFADDMTKDILGKVQRDLAASRFSSAQKKIKPLAKKSPRNPNVQNLAGVSFAAAEMHRAAIPYFVAAYRLDPDNAEIQANLVSSLIMGDEVPKADAVIDRLLKASPRDATLHYLRAYGRQHVGDSKGAIEAATKVLEIDGTHIQALGVRGDAWSKLSNSEAALEDFQQILIISPNQLTALKNCMDRCNELGRKSEALQYCDAILARDPENGFALSRFAVLADAGSLTDIAGTIENALASGSQDSDQKVYLNLAMAEVLKRQGNLPEAMTFFNQMHALDAKSRPYNASAAWAEFKQIRSLFPGLGEAIPSNDSDLSPIFIVGLPRSGTTLVEMVLASHPNIAAFGELGAADHLFHDIFGSRKTLVDGLIEQFAARYLVALPEVPKGKRAFTDKMPMNIRYVGLLLAAFPNAKIINLQRDPRDVALSLWMKRFVSDGMNFASKISGIADQANLYRSYVNHWTAAFPGRILSLDYEDLVQNLEIGSRRIAEYCEVDWTEKMLHPENVGLAVRTASVNQVREKVHARSIGNWPLLGDGLREFTAALDKRLWPEIS